MASSLNGLYAVAFGATAVTGLNAHPKFGETASKHLARETGQPFHMTGNHVAALSGHDAMAATSGALRTLASALMEMATTFVVRIGPARRHRRVDEIPENEPGSSIMPGKINPTHCEALTMVAVQVSRNNRRCRWPTARGSSS